ncbi:MAG TPA: transglutaminase domain-containing protein [Thermoanaerobaculia bacterium]|nr:transglutaminase domain-containing protein [Thermoanaerobaculia bacterium]
MQKNALIVPLLLALAGPAAGASSAPQGTEPSDLKTRTFLFTYRAVVKDIPSGSRSLSVWLPFPQTDRNQTIHQVTVQAPGAVTIGREPRYGNEAVYFQAASPQGPMEITMEVVATRRENAGERETLSPEDARQYLMAEPLVPLDGPVKALAVEATEGKRSDAEKARAIYEKVTGIMKYDKSGTGWGRGDAVWACDAKRGNCTDFHALIIGMARSQGIPARFAIGFPLPEQRGTGEIPGYHCWAEMYVQGKGWVPVDSSEAAKALAAGNTAKKDYFYGHHDENRLEFSRGRHLVLNPRQQGEPLNFFVYPYAEVDGKKHEAVERRVTFEDLKDAPVSREAR